jgi:hypothetical protein
MCVCRTELCIAPSLWQYVKVYVFKTVCIFQHMDAEYYLWRCGCGPLRCVAVRIVRAAVRAVLQGAAAVVVVLVGAEKTTGE